MSGKIAIFHIVHVDRLASISANGRLWSDSELALHPRPGTTIGMSHIKTRRLSKGLASRPGLKVGECVPFYFCPRSVMLYLIHKANHADLQYKGGQDMILHLVADLHETIQWAEKTGNRWAYTLSNAGSHYFEDRCDLSQLGQIDWKAVGAHDWQQCREQKQAEFLCEREVPWNLISQIGVKSEKARQAVDSALEDAKHKPAIVEMPQWYY